MALITRLSRLFHADMNAVLDHIEEPELLLKQAIREMEETLSHNERQMKLSDFEQQKLSSKEDDIKQSLTDLDEQLDVCFESDKDDLARSLIKRKLEAQQFLKSLGKQKSTSQENGAQLKSQLSEHRSQLDSMKQKAAIFNQSNTDDSTSETWTNYSFSIQQEDIEIAFIHEKQKWSQS